MKTLLGYASVLSLRVGDTIDFKVSSEHPYQARIVRLINGDTNPAGPGYQEQEVPVTAWDCPGRPQPVHPGSCLVVQGLPPLVSFALDLLAWPTTPDKPGQVLASRWDAARGAGFMLLLDGAQGLSLQLGDGQGGRGCVRLGSPLFARHWYRFHAAYDAATDTAVLRQTPLMAQAGQIDRAEATGQAGVGGLGSAVSPLVFAACPAADGAIFTGFYNGKLEAPVLTDGAATLGCWDFADGFAGSKVSDISGNALHGTLHQGPTRGMTGHGWTGRAQHFRQTPAEYAAIHFHDDDLEDAGWQTDFSYTPPVTLPSGLYAARLRSATDEDYIPFVLRPAADAPPAGLLFIVPTASYLAYANEHMALDAAFAERVHDHVPAFGPNDVHLAAHRELGGSLYDRHGDGSPIFYSSRLRPILNMRPKYQSWLGGGIGSGLWQLNADTHLLAWLEQTGIAFACISDEDMDAEGEAALAGHACVMTGTHPEYWSTNMRDALDAFQAAGGRTMYMGGNGLYWRIAYNPSGSGSIEVRRGEGGTGPGETHHAYTGEYGGLWRRIGRPPNQAVGVGFIGQGFDQSSYFRRLPDSQDPRAAFIFDGVGDDIIGDFGLIGGGAAGIELDRTDAAAGTPPNVLILARSEHHTGNYLTSLEMLPINCLGHERANPIFAEMVFYETPAGGAVFSTGSIAWAGSLSHDGYENNVAAISGNVLRRFVDPTKFGVKEPL